MALKWFGNKDVKTEVAPSEQPVTVETMRARYEMLCAKRDETNAGLAARKQQLTDIVTQEQVLRENAMALAAEINDIRGPGWLAMKKEIGVLAAALNGRR